MLKKVKKEVSDEKQNTKANNRHVRNNTFNTEN